jgi:hypothetical protein
MFWGIAKNYPGNDGVRKIIENNVTKALPSQNSPGTLTKNITKYPREK